MRLGNDIIHQRDQSCYATARPCCELPTALLQMVSLSVRLQAGKGSYLNLRNEHLSQMVNLKRIICEQR